MSYNIGIAVEPGLEQPDAASLLAAWHDDDAAGWYDDKMLARAVRALGHQAAVVSWEDDTVDFQQFDAVFVTSTWNGCDDPQKYMAWLAQVEADGKRRLINSLRVLRDHFVKPIYMKMLADGLTKSDYPAERGYITPSYFVSSDASSAGQRALHDILAMLDDDAAWRGANIVLKPGISADGKDTFVYNRQQNKLKVDAAKKAAGFEIDDPKTAENHFRRLAANQARAGVIIQPYITGVEEGEYSLTFLGERCYFAIRKPKAFRGDNSRQRQAVALADLPPNMLAFAEHVVKTAGQFYEAGAITRARVDFFVEDGVPVLCELECVDPNCNFRVLRDKVDKTFQEVALLETVFATYAKYIINRIDYLSSPQKKLKKTLPCSAN